MCKLSFCVAVQLSLLTTFAAAQSPASTVKEFDLLGTWALDCSQPAGPRNAYVDFTIAFDGTQGRETDWLNRCDQRRADRGQGDDADQDRSQIPRHPDAIDARRLVLELTETGR